MKKVVDYGAIHSISINEGAGADDLIATFYPDSGGSGTAAVAYVGKELHRIFRDEMTAKERSNFSEKLEEVVTSGFKTMRWPQPKSAFPETSPITTDQIEAHIRQRVRESSDPLKTAGDLIVLLTTAAYEAANDG